MTILREYQAEAVRLIAGSKKDPGYLADSPVAGLIMPTGSGKSVTVAAIVRRLVEAGRFKGAVVAAPQTHIVEAFQAEAPDLWRPASDGKDLARYIGQGEQEGPFGILCAHALLTPSVPVRLPKNLAGRLLVLDEGHHAGASVTAVAGEAKGKDAEHVNKLSALRDRWVKRGGSVLIVTATPWRNDRADVLGGAPVYHRTLAEHMADPAGYCPPRLSVEHVVIQESVAAFKDAKPKVVAKAAEHMAAQWVKDGCPKTVCIVPGRKTEVWIGALEKAFAKHKARTLVTIGATGQAATLRHVLDHERTVTRYADSLVDVMIACKRFDEGTDWPICSHVYVAGLPRQMNTTVQRVGRALRSKKGIKGHPHGKAATITFFAPRWNKDTDEVRRRHRDEAMMLACFMADHETGARFMNDPFVDVLRSRAKGEERGALERLIHRLKASDAERAEAAVAVQKIRVRLGDKATAKDLLGAVRKASDSERWDDRKDVLVTMLVAQEEQRRGNKVLGKAMESALVESAKDAFGLLPSKRSGKSRTKGTEVDIIRAEMRAIWDAAVQQDGLKTVASVDESMLALVSGYTGLDAKGFTESLNAFDSSSVDWAMVDWTKTDVEISKRLKCSETTVWSMRHSLGIIPTRKRRTISEADLSRVDWKMSDGENARRLNVSSGAIGRLRKIHCGVESQFKSKAYDVDWTMVDWTLSNADISRLTGASPMAVFKKRRRLGIDPIRKGRPKKGSVSGEGPRREGTT